MSATDSLLYVTQVAPYGASTARPDLQRRVAGAHGVLGQSATAVAELASMAGLRFQAADDVGALPAEALERARVLALYTIGETPWSDEQKQSILAGVRSGRLGVLALHSTTDSCYEWPEWGTLVGARFDGHPWTQELTIDVADADHPATQYLPSPWRLPDEIYLFRDLRPDARVLLRLDPEGLDMGRPGARVPEHGFPLAWCHAEGEGRVFYTALGHFPAAFESVAYLGHLYGALEWLLH